jgi:hypothetical protein
MSANFEIGSALNMIDTPNYSIDSILNATQATAPKQPSAFRRILGGVAGGALNMVAPGMGSLIGNAIAGGVPGISSNGLLGDASQYLQLQQQMNAQQQAFETASNVLKARHDAMMAAIHNIQ